MVVGTSIGGIIALCIAAGVKIDKLEGVFTELSEKIFSEKRSFLSSFIHSAYDAEVLENTIVDILQRELGLDARTLTFK